MHVVVSSIPLLFSALLFLALARIFLWRRSELRPQNSLRAITAGLDRFFTAADRFFRFSSTKSDQRCSDIPLTRPIAWLESRHRLVGQARHVCRMILLLEAPLIAWFGWVANSPDPTGGNLPQLWIGLWLVALMVVIAISTSLIPGERSRQTLDVLLTTPMNTTDIAVQKMAGLRRLTIVLSIPLLTVLTFQVFWFLRVHPQDAFESVAFFNAPVGTHSLVTLVLRRIAAVFFYLPLVGWIGFQFGMRMRSQFRAMMACIGTLLAACGVPPLIKFGLETSNPFGISDSLAGRVLLDLFPWLNPWFVGFQGEAARWGVFDVLITSDILPPDWFPFLFHFLLVGGMLWAVRRNALRNFSRFAGRLEPVLQRHVQPATLPTVLLFPTNPFETGGGANNETADGESTSQISGTKNE